MHGYDGAQRLFVVLRARSRCSASDDIPSLSGVRIRPHTKATIPAPSAIHAYMRCSAVSPMLSFGFGSVAV